ncbi:MAG TPA: family 10 glycosylhydrolase [Gemmatimonadaceae bacterium]|nr:family 10 glycosylhydrolase [Gemmatimonadaceae bacterium]
MKIRIIFTAFLILSRAVHGQEADAPVIPREFRAIWIATVSNIDWPSKPGLSTWEQQTELTAILNRALKLHMNAVVLQVRPATDALYSSKLEPWSEYLTGQMGRPPEPYYDPLAFAVDEAHKRGLELHAWFNPYRSRHPSARSEIASTHVSNTRPTIVRTYGKHLWLDPGDSAVRSHSVRVLTDVVRRYDVDGIHIDDYFYPYKEKDSAGAVIDFPDSATWNAYVGAGGSLSRDDWRRRNVDSFVRDLYRSIKRTKPWVKFGISPFGVWRTGTPPQIRGFDAYAQLYADSKKWLNEGWVDYFTPQLYWPIARQDVSYPVLLRWWISENAKGRNIWPGNFTSRVGGTGAESWSAQEIIDQISVTRLEPGASGNVHFSAKVFMQNRDSIVDRLLAGPYAGPALVPRSPWLDSVPPRAPIAALRRDVASRAVSLDITRRGVEKTWLWVVRYRFGPDWSTIVLPGWQTTHMFEGGATSVLPDEVLVSAVDRTGNESVASRAVIRGACRSCRAKRN